MRKIFADGRAASTEPVSSSEPVSRPDPSSLSWEGNTEALRALELLSDNSANVVLTGAAGTGKTSLLQSWRQKENPVVLAPTGIAALQAGGATIHSFFGFKPELIRRRDVDGMGEPVRSSLEHLRTLVIDEMSMVRADLMAGIELRLRRYGPSPGKLFGGVKLVLLGDVLQLPPVVDRALRDKFAGGTGYESPWWWEGREVRRAEWEVVELRRPYRQGEPEFIELLQRVRRGQVGSDDFTLLDERVRQTGPDVLRLTSTNRAADDWNAFRVDALPGRASLYARIFEGDQSVLEERWPVPEKLILKLGARVLLIKNDAGGRWVNGEAGTVLRCMPDHVRVQLDRALRPVYDVQRVEWQVMGYRYEEAVGDFVSFERARFTQLPLCLGWARTIHKAQGQSYERAHIDLGAGAFAAGMTYVALSRVRTWDGLTLARPIRAGDVFTDPHAVRWLKERQCGW